MEGLEENDEIFKSVVVVKKISGRSVSDQLYISDEMKSGARK